jgi:hypothetical protein
LGVLAFPGVHTPGYALPPLWGFRPRQAEVIRWKGPAWAERFDPLARRVLKLGT